ncbi:MAG: hypothetical protein JXB03_10945 [Spirochaetales bacterium]|nr:hypothetical protein [Spirochaetales bacterium]
MQLPKIIKILFFFSAFAAAYSQVSAQDIFLPEEEAAPVLYSGSIGNTGVDLFMFGSWSLRASYGTVIPLPGLYPATPYRFTPGPYFQQIPDLTISLWLLNRYFIETSFLPAETGQSTYVMGIQGNEEDFLKAARIGNKGINLPPNKLISFPDGSNQGFGGYAHFGNNRWDNHMLLRFDTFSRETLNYRGTSEIHTTFIPLESYLRGVSFLLPDAGIQSPKVLVQDMSGAITGDDGQTYAVMDPKLYTLANDTGYIEFAAPLTRKTLITYQSNAADPGSPVNGEAGLCGTDGSLLDADAAPEDFSFDQDYLGQPLSQYRVQIAGPGGPAAAIVLWNNNAFSPFENASLYDLDTGADTSFITATLVPPDQTEGTVQVTLAPAQQRVSVVSPEGTPRANTRFPFSSYIADYYGGGKGSLSGWHLSVTRLFPQKSIPAPQDAVPGSLTVFVNGFETTQYTIKNGAITFPFPLKSSDSVQVMYSREGGETNTLMQTSYHRYQVSDALFFHGATAFMWTLARESASSYYGQYPGFFLTTAGFEYTGTHLDAGFEYTGAIGTSDATGALELSGLSETQYSVSPQGRLIIPAVQNSINLDPSDRVFGMYKDYRIQAETGITYYQDIGWAIPSSLVANTATGSQLGPYIAKGNSLGYSLLFSIAEAELEQHQWSGMTLKLDEQDTPPDSISFVAGYLGAGEVDLYMRIGAIEEDLDGDNILDEEPTSGSQGFYVDGGGGSYRFGGGLVTPGNGSLDTEDLNGDGFISPEDSSMLIEVHLGTLDESTGFSRMHHAFTDSQKAQLKALRGVQFIMQARSSTGTSGRLCVGDVYIQQQGIRTDSATGTLSFRETEEEVRYQWTAETEPHSVTIPFTPFPPRSYGELSLEYSLENTGGTDPQVLLFLKTGDQTGYSTSVNLDSSPGTHEIKIQLKTMTVLVNGSTYSLSPVAAGSGGSAASFRALGMTFLSSPQGVLKLSKPYAKDPLETIEHGGKFHTTLRMPAVFPWLDGRLESNISAATGSIADTLVPDLSYRHLRIHEEQHLTFPGTAVSLYQHLEVNEFDDEYGFGHTLKVSPVTGMTLHEFYHFSPQKKSALLESGNGISLSWPLANLTINTNAIQNTADYVQSWNNALLFPFAPSFSIELTQDLSYNISNTSGIGSYGQSWMDIKELMYTNSSTRSFYREHDLNVRSQWDPSERTNVLGSLTFSTLSHYDPLPKTVKTCGWDLKVKLPAGSGSVDTGIAHQGAATGPWDRSGDAYADMRDLFTAIPPYRELFFPVPGWHLHPDAFQAAPDAQSTETQGNASLGYTRPGSNPLTDLLIPVRGEYRVERSYQKNPEAAADEYRHHARISWDTKNLFGRFGRYTRWMIYDTESLSSSIDMSMNDDFEEYAFIHESSLTIYTKGDTVAEGSHSFRWNQNEIRDDLKLLWTWNKPIRSTAFFNDVLVTDTLQHSQETGASFGNREYERFFHTYFRHESNFLFDPWGFLGLYGEITWLFQTSEHTGSSGIGVEVGIRGELTF